MDRVTTKMNIEKTFKQVTAKLGMKESKLANMQEALEIKAE